MRVIFAMTGNPPLRMSSTGRQNFWNVQHIIIHATFGQKLMKKFTVTNEKIFRVHKAFDHKNNSHADLRASHAQFSGKDCQYREEDSENKILS